MKITGIEQQKFNKDRYNVFVDNEFVFSANIEEILKFDIKINKEITLEEIKHYIYDIEVKNGYKYALNLLNIKDYSEKEIREKLYKKGFCDSSINEIIIKLIDYNFIDDKRYATKYITDKMKNKKIGKFRIINELKSKGIQSDIINNIYIDDNLQIENAYKLATKKLNSLKEKDIQKIKRFLYYKGYESDIIEKVIYKLTNKFE